MSRAVQCCANLFTAAVDCNWRLNRVSRIRGWFGWTTAIKLNGRFNWRFHFLLLLTLNLRHCGFDSHAIGFSFERVVLDHRDAAAERISNAARFLLQHVPKLVAQQFLTLMWVQMHWHLI